MTRRCASSVSDSTAVTAGATSKYVWTNDKNGPVKLTEIQVAFDMNLQAGGKFTIRIAGHLAMNHVSSLPTVNSMGFSNMEDDIAKGETVEVEVYNGGSSTGYFAVEVNAHEESE